MAVKFENVKWVDGLRGFASFTVVVTHISRGMDVSLFLPANDANTPARFLQWPFVRVLIQGRLGVAIFSLVTGYVCALKPIRQAKMGNYEGALVSISKSAFRRVPRLIIPTTMATCLIWLLSQFGVFVAAKNTDSFWISYTAPDMTPFFGASLRTLAWNIIRTWEWGQNMFDPNQWTLQPLLKGSMLVYIATFATIYLEPRYRMMCSLALWAYYYIGNDSAYGLQFFFGMFLSDLQNHQPAIDWAASRRWTRTILTPLLLFLGTLLASYPEDHSEFARWSHYLYVFSTWILPNNYDKARFTTGLGLQLMVMGIHFSPRIKDLLSNKYFLWLGKNSFAVYLIHGGLLRWWLVWACYGMSPNPDIKQENGEIRGGDKLHLKSWPHLVFWIPIWFVAMYACADLWTRYVDPMCARWSLAIERYVWKDMSVTAPLPTTTKREDGPPYGGMNGASVEPKRP